MLQRSPGSELVLRQRSVGDRVGVEAATERAALLRAQTEVRRSAHYTKPFGTARGPARQLVYYQSLNYGQTPRRSEECARFV